MKNKKIVEVKYTDEDGDQQTCHVGVDGVVSIETRDWVDIEGKFRFDVIVKYEDGHGFPVEDNFINSIKRSAKGTLEA